jgi:predicted MFS family arabinose efflux permease
LGAIAALAVDVFSYAASAVLVTISGVTAGRLRSFGAPGHASGGPEPIPTRASLARAAEAFAGVRHIFGQRTLRALTAEAATFNLLDQGLLPLFLLYAVSDSGIGATGYGLVLTAGGVGTLIGALGSDIAIARWGFGRLLVTTAVAGCASYLLIPALAGTPARVTIALMAGMFLSGLATGIANVQAVTLRQLITPDELIGRVTAAFRAVAFGAVAFGAVGGGLLGEWLGLRQALWVLALLLLTTPLWLVFSPIRSLRSLSELPA